MAGLHLQQLRTACLALGTSYSTALSAAGLTPLAATEGEPRRQTKATHRPELAVSFEGDRAREQMALGAPVDLEITVSFAVRVWGDEAAALGYEGVLEQLLAGSGPTITAAVTDAAVNRWELAGGDSSADEERTNRDAWQVTVTVRVGMEVSAS